MINPITHGLKGLFSDISTAIHYIIQCIEGYILNEGP